MRLFYKKTDGGAEYYCLHHIGDGETGDLTTAILRIDGDNVLELNTYKLAQMGIFEVGLYGSVVRFRYSREPRVIRR